MRLGIVFIPLSLWISGPFISVLKNTMYSTHIHICTMVNSNEVLKLYMHLSKSKGISF